MRVLVWHGKSGIDVYDATDIEAAYMQYFRDSEKWAGPWEGYIYGDYPSETHQRDLVERARLGNFSAAREFMSKYAIEHEYFISEVVQTRPAAERYSPEL